jgi:hypothetical protein
MRSSVFFIVHRIIKFSNNEEGLLFTPEPVSTQQSSTAEIKVILPIAILSVTNKGLHTKSHSSTEVLAFILISSSF